MFRLYLMPLNPEIRKKWLIMGGLAMGGTGTFSVVSLIDQVRKMFPAEVLMQYDHFLYVALAIALLSALPLLAFPNVLTLTITQLSFATSIQYFACALFGVFVSGTEHVVLILMMIIAIAFFITFCKGFEIIIVERSVSDFLLGFILLLIFSALWVIPIIKLWR